MTNCDKLSHLLFAKPLKYKGFNFKNSCIARAANGKGEYKERGNKKYYQLNIHQTL